MNAKAKLSQFVPWNYASSAAVGLDVRATRCVRSQSPLVDQVLFGQRSPPGLRRCIDQVTTRYKRQLKKDCLYWRTGKLFLRLPGSVRITVGNFIQGDLLAHDFANQASKSSKRERFDLRREPDDTWIVYDIFSGLVVNVGGVFMMDLNVDVAFYVVDELNDQDFKRRIALGF